MLQDAEEFCVSEALLPTAPRGLDEDIAEAVTFVRGHLFPRRGGGNVGQTSGFLSAVRTEGDLDCKHFAVVLAGTLLRKGYMVRLAVQLPANGVGHVMVLVRKEPGATRYLTEKVDDGSYIFIDADNIEPICEGNRRLLSWVLLPDLRLLSVPVRWKPP